MFGNRIAFLQVWNNPYVRVSVWLLVAYLSFTLFKQLSSVLTMATLAYVFAYLFFPVLLWLEKHKVSRSFGVVLVFLLIVAVLSIASVLLVAVANQLGELIKQIPILVTLLRSWGTSLSSWVHTYPYLETLSAQLDQVVNSNSAELQKYAATALQKFLGQGGGALLGGLVQLAGGVFQAFLLLILSAYMMIDFERVGQTLLSIFPKPWQPLILEVSGHISTAIGGYLRGQVLIAVSVGFFIGLGLTIFGIPSGIALGFLAGLFNIVPYMGAIIAIIPAILMGLSISWVKAIIVVVVFTVVNQIEGHVLSPMILGRTTNLHPATVLLSILCGVELFGIVGALLAVPIVALGKLLLAAYYYPSRSYHGLEGIEPTMIQEDDIAPK